MATDIWFTAVLAGAIALGAVAGMAGRLLLGRLSRGAQLRPPWCEVAVATLAGVAVLRALSGALPLWWLPIPLVLGWWAVLLTGTDLRHRRLPDALTLPAYPVAAVLLGVAAAAGPGGELLARAAAGAVLFLAVHGAVHLLSPASLGAGDVKLAGTVGAVLAAVSWPAVLLGALVASVATLVVGLGLRWAAHRSQRARWRRPVVRGDPWPALGPGMPHGPGMLAAVWLIAVFPAVSTWAGTGLCLIALAPLARAGSP